MYSEKLKRERIKSSISLKKKKNHRTVVVLSSSPVTCLACFLLTSPRKGSNSPLLPNSSGVSCCHSHAAECPDHQLHERKMSTRFWICSSREPPAHALVSLYRLLMVDKCQCTQTHRKTDSHDTLLFSISWKQ